MTFNKKKVSVLECTLRDGSYLIDYQFTAEDTYIICVGLERAGFKLIEIGHGTGLGSSKAGKGKAAATDEEYLEAARSALSESNAGFGMFFIPGIGKMDDLIMAADYGMSFIRIGTNITEVDQAGPYIEKAKELGMTVSSNLMKSYAVSIDEFVRQAKIADDFGADTISIVDSAGGMFPEDVKNYVLRLKDTTDKNIGFHGHNNLQLAMANTLEAVKAGVAVVDSSLQGMGRSAGNAQTEVLVTILDKFGYNTGIDSYKAMDLGERVIKPMMNREQGVDDISLVSGIALFHSSFYRIICDTAEKYQVDPRKLIIEVSKMDRVTVSEELAREAALKIIERDNGNPSRSNSLTLKTDILREKDAADTLSQAQLISEEITSQSKKTGKESVFSITLSRTGTTSFPFIRQSSSFIIGNVEACELKEAENLISQLDGNINWLLLDESSSQLRNSNLDSTIQKSRFAWYSEERVLRFCICALLAQKKPKGMVMILSDNESIELLKLSLEQQGIPVMTSQELHSIDDYRPSLAKIGAIVSFGVEHAMGLTNEHVPYLSNDTAIYAARPNAFSKSFWESAISRNQPICRVDSRAALAAELSLVIETRKLINSMGSTALSGIPVVAGGVIGRLGNVVIDSIKSPTRVIGIADGLGGLLRSEEENPYLKAKEKVREHLIKNLYRT